MDWRLYHAIYGVSLHHHWLGTFFDDVERASIPFMLVATVALWLIARPGGGRKWKLAAGSGLAAAALALLVNVVLHTIWDRPRPYETHVIRHPWSSGRRIRSCACSGGAPSRLEQPGRQVRRELSARQAPPPVASGRTRPVHACLATEAERVLRRHDRQRRARGERELDQAPVRLGRVEPRGGALAPLQAPVPADGRVGVM